MIRETKIYTAYRYFKYLINKRNIRKNRIANIAMLHYGRCGSSVLGSLLNQHDNIRWDSEIFQTLKHDKNKIFESKFSSDFIKILNYRKYSYNDQFYGFETKIRPEAHLGKDYINLSLEKYLEFLLKNEFNKIIILRRNNYLRQMFSIAKGIQNKNWHLKNQEVRKNKLYK